MKELSIEEKAKAYDEAIEIAKKINNEQQAQPFNVMTRVFPELKESEDERIRKKVIDVLKLNVRGAESQMQALGVGAANTWCRCFKCDGIVNSTHEKCEKDKLLTCHKWYDGYRTALLAISDYEQQLMAKAVDAVVKVDAGGYPYIPQMELYDYDKDILLAKEGDKYKVILIKEG